MVKPELDAVQFRSVGAGRDKDRCPAIAAYDPFVEAWPIPQSNVGFPPRRKKRNEVLQMAIPGP